MSKNAIVVENLSKVYLIGHRRAYKETLREVIGREFSNFTRKAAAFARGRQVVQGDDVEEFWALNNVSFEVKQGEILGIIGRNGAGKSTLLKILSRITEPTQGQIFLQGRVSSLLEVGTGFHPDLTGRENVFLNGAILGMTQREIRRKFEEIVAFADIEKFLDTPVKRYSSGMYVRLAFAVAAHLEPEILIVDEVLAVGDTEFQKKCLGKIENVAQSGRTVLFVSHDVGAVERLTSRCLLLSNGKLLEDGPTRGVVTNYLHSSQPSEVDLARHRLNSIPETVSIQKIWTETTVGQNSKNFRQGESFRIGIQIDVKNVRACDLLITIENSRQHAIFTTLLSDLSPPVTTSGLHNFYLNIDNPNLRTGKYLISFGAYSPDHITCFDLVRYIPSFQIAGALEQRPVPHDGRDGDIYLPIKWQASTS
jgi:lipopolysaccharide transport system ATP-binding protein